LEEFYEKICGSQEDAYNWHPGEIDVYRYADVILFRIGAGFSA
jgi:hypothetical protein